MKKEVLFAHFPKMSFHRYQQLLVFFSSAENAWKGEFDEFKKCGWEENVINEFLEWRDKCDENKIQKVLTQEGISCLTKDDISYPKLLKEIYDPPICLFVRGEIIADELFLAIVGSRKNSIYGQQITEKMTGFLASQGITIVSGLAFGIDSIAHETAVAKGGKTIAVLGSGIDKKHVTPPAHRSLAEKIIHNNGAIISEYPPGAMANKYTFPRRNRIVAGMSFATLVIEAAEGSGALITAECALDNGREVMAVPQNITAPNSVGVNNLIKKGAHPITKPEDILEILNWQNNIKLKAQKNTNFNTPLEEKICQTLSTEPKSIEQIIKETGLDSASVNATLMIMEIAGKARDLGGKMYVITK